MEAIILPLLMLFLLLAVIGVLCWAVVTYIPMPEPIKGIIILVAVIAAIFILLRWVGQRGVSF